MQQIILITLLSFPTYFLKSQTLEEETKILIEQGTVLKVRATERANSNKIQEGEEVIFEVYEQLDSNGKVLIKEGTLVKAYVESVEKSRSLGKEGYIKIEFVSTTAIDGTKIPLRALRGSVSGTDRQENSLALTVFLGPAFLLLKGGQAKVNEGKIMRVNVTKDVFIKVN